MGIENHIQGVLVHLVESFHHSSEKGENVIDIEAREVIEDYLQSKIKSMRDLIKKEIAF